MPSSGSSTLARLSSYERPSSLRPLGLAERLTTLLSSHRVLSVMQMTERHDLVQAHVSTLQSSTAHIRASKWCLPIGRASSTKGPRSPVALVDLLSRQTLGTAG